MQEAPPGASLLVFSEVLRRVGSRVVPDEPYLFVADPDGYMEEIWYELPTPVDPP